MLTIKDFKTNDPAVILTMNHGRNEDPVISEVKIGSVGRKYVTINNGPFEKNFKTGMPNTCMKQVIMAKDPNYL